MPDLRVWLVGENNPYQDNAEDGQRFAMYPEPEESAGGRLCNLILGMHKRDYLRSFERRNLLHQPRWSVPDARAAARALRREMASGDVALLLGRKVFEAFFRPVEWEWTLFRAIRETTTPLTFLALPHPSGLNRFWNDFKSYSAVRAFVAEHAPHLAPLLGRSELTRGRTAAEREVAGVG